MHFHMLEISLPKNSIKNLWTSFIQIKFSTVWLRSGFPENRIRILKPKEQLDALDDEDEDVFLLPTSWTDIQPDQTL